MEGFREWGAEFELSESNISAGKNWGVGTINQSVHLVGSHMADQHANSANLLMFSNGVQLIPPAAFISPSHTEGRQVEKEREERIVCYDSSLFLLNYFLLFFSPSWSRGIKLRWWMRWTRGPRVAAAVVVGKEGETRKSGEIRKLREEETAVGMIFF